VFGSHFFGQLCIKDVMNTTKPPTGNDAQLAEVDQVSYFWFVVVRQ